MRTKAIVGLDLLERDIRVVTLCSVWIAEVSIAQCNGMVMTLGLAYHNPEPTQLDSEAERMQPLTVRGHFTSVDELSRGEAEVPGDPDQFLRMKAPPLERFGQIGENNLRPVMLEGFDNTIKVNSHCHRERRW